jgi:ABC-type nitrate/sulfonate/bicarbonate transport system permease component
MLSSQKLGRGVFLFLGCCLVPIVWIAIKTQLGVSDLYLPSPLAVLRAAGDIRPSIFTHVLYTASRLIIGYSVGVVLGIALTLLMFRSLTWTSMLLPSVQSLRAVPAAALVPFFLLWFGFSEIGRYLLVVGAVAFNIAIAGLEVLAHTPENHRAVFHSFGLSARRLTLRYALPRVLEAILPTLRFSLALAIGAVTVSELLGSQVGLGYLIQSGRSTFSLDVIFLSTILLGVLAAATDGALTVFWNGLVSWKAKQ